MKILTNKRYNEIINNIRFLEKQLENAEQEFDNNILEINQLKLKNTFLEKDNKALIKKLDEEYTRFAEVDTENAGNILEIERLNTQLSMYKANHEADKNVIKGLNGAKGGLTKQIHKLEKTLEETKKKLEESMTDKYLVKKIPIGRLPKSQVMKLRTHEKQDKIVQKIYDKLNKED